MKSPTRRALAEQIIPVITHHMSEADFEAAIRPFVVPDPDSGRAD